MLNLQRFQIEYRLKFNRAEVDAAEAAGLDVSEFEEAILIADNGRTMLDEERGGLCRLKEPYKRFNALLMNKPNDFLVCWFYMTKGPNTFAVGVAF